MPPFDRAMTPECEAAFGAAEAARRRGDAAGEAAALRRALKVLLDTPTDPDVAAVEGALRSAPMPLQPAPAQRLLLFAAANLGLAIELSSPGEARAWLHMAEAMAGLPRNGEDPLFPDLRAIIGEGLRRLLMVLGDDDQPPGREPTQFGSAYGVATAMGVARRIAMEDREGAVAHLRAAVDALDPAAPRADEVVPLAVALMEELLADTPLDARRAALRQAALLQAVPGDGRHVGQVVQHMNASVHARAAGRRDLALRDAETALRATAQPEAQDLAWCVLAALAEHEAHFGHPRAAILLDKLALAKHCALRRSLLDFDPGLATLDESARGLLDRLVAQLAAAGRLEEAEQAAALGRARAVARLPSPALVAAEQGVAAAVEAVRTGDESSLRFVLDRMERVVHPRAIDPAMDGSRHGTGADDDGATLALSFIASGGQLACLARRGGQARMFQLGLSPEEANRLSYRVRRAVLDRRTDPTPLLGEAYDVLLRGPMAALGDGAARAVIGAPAGLQALPWSALHDGRRHLVERMALVRATAPGVDLRAPPRTPVRLAAFAATRGAAGLEPLGNDAAAEAQAVAAMAPAAPAMLDSDFTRAALDGALRAASVLHLATHFVADPAALGQSRLLLGDGTTLALPELVRTDLSELDLVILSACSTAARGDTAEGISGVDALLLAGGARAALGTLWPVDSGAMRILVPAVVAGLAEGLDKAEALARAQRGLASGRLGHGAYRLPCFFAAPVLCGNIQSWPALAWAGPHHQSC